MNLSDLVVTWLRDKYPGRITHAESESPFDPPGAYYHVSVDGELALAIDNSTPAAVIIHHGHCRECPSEDERADYLAHLLQCQVHLKPESPTFFEDLEVQLRQWICNTDPASFPAEK
jgi:hypothetical protein